MGRRMWPRPVESPPKWALEWEWMGAIRVMLEGEELGNALLDVGEPLGVFLHDLLLLPDERGMAETLRVHEVSIDLEGDLDHSHRSHVGIIVPLVRVPDHELDNILVGKGLGVVLAR